MKYGGCTAKLRMDRVILEDIVGKCLQLHLVVDAAQDALPVEGEPGKVKIGRASCRERV